ncbi:DUF4148 domain-containing protein [Paraburkholderia sp. J67]|uniref:DUF4148 domain-containing protein n=1 Tax=Paraburkholderia sp. J67 TaxID=2805435 RepID=UPI002ABD9C79|nr:DUF4148 domain-containing protein [Paraburkholderia sp. J67]
MKLIQSLIAAAAVALPVASFAQTSQPVTRAQVLAELAQLEKAGYNPASNDVNYPQDIQAAEARVSAQNLAASAAYGGVANGASASGAASSAFSASLASTQDDVPGLGPIFAHP